MPPKPDQCGQDDPESKRLYDKASRSGIPESTRSFVPPHNMMNKASTSNKDTKKDGLSKARMEDHNKMVWQRYSPLGRWQTQTRQEDPWHGIHCGLDDIKGAASASSVDKESGTKASNRSICGHNGSGLDLQIE